MVERAGRSPVSSSSVTRGEQHIPGRAVMGLQRNAKGRVVVRGRHRRQQRCNSRQEDGQKARAEQLWPRLAMQPSLEPSSPGWGLNMARLGWVSNDNDDACH
ncbi:unnamed protein product [Rangifer tarandus platyrhynchus]|uniref:Uncharacterized protein n=2 Tax=Rangifer tarandus platyrhynchus TaxID=3082113 RepID=A0ACB0FD77_RANTA|nr:unnamed protein product [Rangifer tarandus platyrhynchus]CAI9710987.1 unnamed protein product [Rangifer tarandus platyrhynchus]